MRRRTRDVELETSFWQVDQDDIRVLAQSVKNNLFAIGSDVEFVQTSLIAKSSQLTLGTCGEIEHPKIPELVAGYVDQALAVGEEPIAAGAEASPNVW